MEDKDLNNLIKCMEKLDSKLDKWLENAAKCLVEDFGKEKALEMFPELEEYLQD